MSGQESRPRGNDAQCSYGMPCVFWSTVDGGWEKAGFSLSISIYRYTIIFFSFREALSDIKRAFVDLINCLIPSSS